MTLAELVTKHGVGPKLKAAVMRARGWRSPKFGEPGECDWYRNWPTFSRELAAAITEVRR